jgi:hypothetical protein
MGIETFKELASLRADASKYKAEWDKKRAALKASQKAIIETAFNTYFKTHGFTLEKTVNNIQLATFSGQDVRLEFSNEDTMSLLHGSIDVNKNKYGFRVQAQHKDGDTRPSLSINSNKSKDEQEIATLKRDIDIYKNYNPDDYVYSYALFPSRESGKQGSAHKAFSELLDALFS